jgi:hypothetical protein
VRSEFEKPDEILQILSSGSFDELNGALENEFFEAKQLPWDLEKLPERLSLAKDISSFANGSGGIIVVGLVPGPADTYERNEVKEIRPLPTSLRPNDDRYQHIIQEFVYPEIYFQVRWHPVQGDPEHGLLSINVPSQDEALRPFLVTRYIDERGKTVASLFALHQRLGATTKPTPVHEFHTLLREGRRLDGVYERLDAIRPDEIHQKLDAIIASSEREAVSEIKRWMQRTLQKIRQIGG